MQILEDAAEGEDGNGRPLDEHGRPVPFTVVVTRVLETDPDHRPVPVTFSKPDYEGKGDSNLNGCEGQTLELRLTLVIKVRSPLFPGFVSHVPTRGAVVRFLLFALPARYTPPGICGNAHPKIVFLFSLFPRYVARAAGQPQEGQHPQVFFG